MGKRACLNKLTQIPVHQAASSLYNQLPVVKLHGLAARPLEKRSDLSPFMVFAEPPSCVAMAPNTEARAPPRSLAPHCARLSAISRGDSPPESTAFVLAPAWRRMSTALPCPLTTAQWSGVRPQLSVTSTGSPTPLAPLLLPCRPPPFLPFCLLPPPAAQRSSSAVHTCGERRNGPAKGRGKAGRVVCESQEVTRRDREVDRRSRKQEQHRRLDLVELMGVSGVPGPFLAHCHRCRPPQHGLQDVP